MSGFPFAPFDPGGELAVTRGLAAQLTHLAQLVSADGEVGADQIKTAAADLVLDLLPAVSWVSITELVTPALEPRTTASSDEEGSRLDGYQYAAGQGPCLEALTGGEVVSACDLHADDRWPDFTRRIPADHPVRAMRSYPLTAAGGVVASLNLYSSRAVTHGEESLQAAHVVAAVTSLVIVAINARQHGDRVTAALADNRQVAMATGVLIGRHGWTQEEAFTALRGHLQPGHDARDVAAHVIATGELPS